MNIGGRVVVLGGYGNFGERICHALAREGHAEVIVAGRSLSRAESVVKTLRQQYPQAILRPMQLDIEDPQFVRRLGSVAPIVVVHAAGPFQAQDYRVAEACISCRSHYLDLADGRGFVTGFHELNRDARRRDLLLVSGASTLPGVSSVVVDALSFDLAQIDSISTAIIPAHRTSPGRATISGVMKYCGKPVRSFSNGEWVHKTGWHDARTIAIAGRKKRVAACDVPDLELFPAYYKGVQTVAFDAGPELLLQHHIIRMMARLARKGIVADWSRYASIMSGVNGLTPFLGSDTGYMQIQVKGRDASSRNVTRVWDLVAERKHGPEIPCIPSTLLVRKLLQGVISERGARPCLSLFSLDDFDREAARFTIAWNISSNEEWLSDAAAA